MPLTGVTYSKTASFLPSNATNPSYSWTITGGTISSGATSSVVNYSFTSTGSKSLSLNITNNCSSVNSSATFTVCNPISGQTVNGASSVVQNSSGSYSVSWTQGTPVSYSWGVSGTGVSITSGQTAQTAVIHFGSTGNALICVDVYDCDGNNYSDCITVDQTLTGCIGLSSCSIS